MAVSRLEYGTKFKEWEEWKERQERAARELPDAILSAFFSPQGSQTSEFVMHEWTGLVKL